MSDERRAMLAEARAYLERAKSPLRLAHWTFVVEEKGPESCDALAHVVCLDTRYHATFRFSDAHMKDSPEERRDTYTHELVHCLLAQLDFAAAQFEHAMDELSWRHLRAAHVRQLELAVDALAAVIAPHLPLPGQPGDALTGFNGQGFVVPYSGPTFGTWTGPRPGDA